MYLRYKLIFLWNQLSLHLFEANYVVENVCLCIWAVVLNDLVSIFEGSTPIPTNAEVIMHVITEDGRI